MKRWDYLWLAIILGLLAGPAWMMLGCERARPTDATAVTVDARRTWRGARLTGHRAAELAPLLEAAWPAVAARWPDWEPAGWRIEGWAARIPCAEAVNGVATGCRGTTEPGRRRIRLSWINGPDDVIAVARWELCNSARWEQAGELQDVGCAR